VSCLAFGSCSFVIIMNWLADDSHSLEKDPAHLEFVASLEDIIQNVRVVDFEPGVF
jgi:hypothetical protein